MNRFYVRLAAATPFVAASTLAMACPPDSEESAGQALHPVALSLYGDDHKQTIKIEVNNDDVKAWVNGEEVPADRVRRQDGRVIILDEHGQELQDIFVHAGGDGGHWATAFGDLTFPDGALEWEKAVAAAEAGPPPTVMLGIMMDEPGPALLKQLDLEEGATTLISAVHEGLPAHQAGLAEFDIIVKIDGDGPADPARIREVLLGKKPGDSVKFKVISSGKDRDVKITLAAYDAKKMESAAVLGGGGAGTTPAMIELHRALVEAGVNDAELKEKLHRELLIAPDSRMRMFRVAPHFEGGMQDVVIEREQMHAAVEERLAELDERLARLEELLEQLMEAQGENE